MDHAASAPTPQRHRAALPSAVTASLGSDTERSKESHREWAVLYSVASLQPVSSTSHSRHNGRRGEFVCLSPILPHRLCGLTPQTVRDGSTSLARSRALGAASVVWCASGRLRGWRGKRRGSCQVVRQQLLAVWEVGRSEYIPVWRCGCSLRLCRADRCGLREVRSESWRRGWG